MKKAIIVGGSSGLGVEISSEFIKKHIPVINISRTESSSASINIKTDLSKDEEVLNCIKIIKEEHSDFDILILAPGILHWNNVGEIPKEVLENEFEVNIKGSMKFVNGLIDIIKNNKGDIVIIGSTSSFTAYSGSAVYTVTKHAVLGFIKALQVEFKKENVRVIGFHPGGFKSQLHVKAKSNINFDSLMDPSDLAKLIINILELPRNMEVSEIIINRKTV